jgi:hypothetical protein
LSSSSSTWRNYRTGRLSPFSSTIFHSHSLHHSTLSFYFHPPLHHSLSLPSFLPINHHFSSFLIFVFYISKLTLFFLFFFYFLTNRHNREGLHMTNSSLSILPLSLHFKHTRHNHHPVYSHHHKSHRHFIIMRYHQTFGRLFRFLLSKMCVCGSLLSLLIPHQHPSQVLTFHFRFLLPHPTTTCPPQHLSTSLISRIFLPFIKIQTFLTHTHHTIHSLMLGGIHHLTHNTQPTLMTLRISH